MRILAGCLLLACVSQIAFAAKPLEIFFIDVEGGQATLFVTPSKQSLLVDTGWAGFSHRDANRIALTAKKAGIKAIDYLWITHYHPDHVGGVSQLLEKIPVRNFVDHGPNTETGKGPKEISEAYEAALKTGNHLVLKPGDTIPLKGIDLVVVAANGEHITQPLKLAGGTAGGASPLCDSAPPFPVDDTENARSLGFVLAYGNFRISDLGDLTSAKEKELVCPKNLIGTVDVFLTNHHGLATSNSAVLVHALHPRVAIMNNGSRKGGDPAAWQIVKDSPGLEDLWQVHYSIPGEKEHNVSEPLIANLDEGGDEGNSIRLTAMPDGSFTVLNTRNKYTKSYRAK